MDTCEHCACLIMWVAEWGVCVRGVRGVRTLINFSTPSHWGKMTQTENWFSSLLAPQSQPYRRKVREITSSVSLCWRILVLVDLLICEFDEFFNISALYFGQGVFSIWEELFILASGPTVKLILWIWPQMWPFCSSDPLDLYCTCLWIHFVFTSFT